MYLRGQHTPCYFSALDFVYCRFYAEIRVLYSFYDEGAEWQSITYKFTKNSYTVVPILRCVGYCACIWANTKEQNIMKTIRIFIGNFGIGIGSTSTMYLEGNYSPVLVDIHNITFYDVQDFFVYDFYTNI